VLVALTVAPAGATATVTAVRVVDDAAFPAAFAIARPGRIIYAERLTGRIVSFNARTGTRRNLFTVPDLAAPASQGLIGLTLSRGFPDVPFIYAHATRSSSGGVENQIVRIRVEKGRGVAMRVIFRAPTSVTFHNGGPLVVGPDGALYVTLGDAGTAAFAQDPANPHGKIVRLSGTTSSVFASGIRNSFGLAFDPWSGRLWGTDNGPECNDELNRYARGGNYGWGPGATCASPPPAPKNTNQDGARPRLPLAWDVAPVAPTGAAFCGRCGLGAAREGRLFYGTFVTHEIREVTLGPRRLGVRSEQTAYIHTEGVIGMARGPRGRLYFSDADAIYKLALR
jgi:glucose/arabinose dehydrogenase